jgi:hypothetical protein
MPTPGTRTQVLIMVIAILVHGIAPIGFEVGGWVLKGVAALVWKEMGHASRESKKSSVGAGPGGPHEEVETGCSLVPVANGDHGDGGWAGRRSY